jgi:hypothetical protein
MRLDVVTLTGPSLAAGDRPTAGWPAGAHLLCFGMRKKNTEPPP